MLLAFNLFGPQKVDIDVPILSLSTAITHSYTPLYIPIVGLSLHLLNQRLAFVECFRANSTAKLLHYKNI